MNNKFMGVSVVKENKKCLLIHFKEYVQEIDLREVFGIFDIYNSVSELTTSAQKNGEYD